MASVLALTGMTPSTAQALEKWDFGKAAYGSRVSAKPAWAKVFTCHQEGCDVTDADGVDYFAWTGWDNEIVIKRLFLVKFTGTRLPYGLVRSDTETAVVSRVKTNTGKVLSCSALSHKSETVPEASRMCAAEVGPKDSNLWLQIYFAPDGRMRLIELWTHYV
ncbi:MAG: hypothetical protein QM667_01130 [Asticcacaulis sp.]